MTLEEVNAVIQDHGYLILDRPQYTDIVACLGSKQLELYVSDVREHGRGAKHWTALRNVLYAVSEHCQATLGTAGLKTTRRQVLLASIKESTLRGAIVALRRKQEEQHADAESLDLCVRRAMGLLGQPERAARSFDHVHKVYGRRFAFAFEQASDQRGAACLQVESAERGSGRDYDWLGKISVQLSTTEVVGLLGVIRGASTEATFSHHGLRRDKHFTVRRQDGGFYLNLRQGAVSRTTPMRPAEAFGVQKQALLTLAGPGGSVADVIAMVNDFYRSTS